MADSVVPLCSAAQFTEGGFADLASGYSATPLQDILIEATRMCESETGRRLAPFTVTETHRATGIDPDEYADSANLPMDLQGTLGASYAMALGASSLVRHLWLSEFAARYQDLWAYSNVSVTIIRSYGGTERVTPAQILGGPEPDTGHLWFQLGIFLPIGSRLRATYSGEYVTMPADLVRACKYVAASIILRELNPEDNTTGHDPELLHTEAMLILENYRRDD